jgi:nucleoside-diphosphate-sugar epimerase
MVRAFRAPSRYRRPYAIHKLAVEQLLGVYRKQHRLDTRILRYANVYGPRQDPHGEAGVVAIFLAAALEGRPLRVNGMHEIGDGGCGSYRARRDPRAPERAVDRAQAARRTSVTTVA